MYSFLVILLPFVSQSRRKLGAQRKKPEEFTTIEALLLAFKGES